MILALIDASLILVHQYGSQNCDLFFDKVYGDDYDQVKGFKYFDRFKSLAETAQVLNGEKPGCESEKERTLVYNVECPFTMYLQPQRSTTTLNRKERRRA